MRTLAAKTLLAVTATLLVSTPSAPARAADAAPKDVPACPTKQDNPAATPLLRRIERSLDGRSSIGTVQMTITTQAWSRMLKMRIWTKGRKYALIRILEGGPRETGMMTLKRDRQLWDYLPRAGRVMKLPSGMLGDSWMGSDFTNDDLVRGTSIVDDFDSQLVGRAAYHGHDTWQLKLIPKPQSVVVWGKVEMLVDRASCVPLIQRFYDEDGKVARTMTFSAIRRVGWRYFPTTMVIKPADSARQTIVTYQNIQFDVDVPDETFSLHRLQRGR